MSENNNKFRRVEASFLEPVLDYLAERGANGLGRGQAASDVANEVMHMRAPMGPSTNPPGTFIQPRMPGAPDEAAVAPNLLDKFFHDPRAGNTLRGILGLLNYGSIAAVNALGKIIPPQTGILQLGRLIRALPITKNTLDIDLLFQTKAISGLEKVVLVANPTTGVRDVKQYVPASPTLKNLLDDAVTGAEPTYVISDANAYNASLMNVKNQIVDKHQYDSKINVWAECFDALIIGGGAAAGAITLNNMRNKIGEPGDTSDPNSGYGGALDTNPQTNPWAVDSSQTDPGAAFMKGMEMGNQEGMPQQQAPSIQNTMPYYNPNEDYGADMKAALGGYNKGYGKLGASINPDVVENTVAKFAAISTGFGRLGQAVNPISSDSQNEETPEQVATQLPTPPVAQDVFNQFMEKLGNGSSSELQDAVNYLQSVSQSSVQLIAKYQQLAPHSLTNKNASALKRFIIAQGVGALLTQGAGAELGQTMLQGAGNFAKGLNNNFGADPQGSGDAAMDSDQTNLANFSNQEQDASTMMEGQGVNRQDFDSLEKALEAVDMDLPAIPPFIMQLAEISNESGCPAQQVFAIAPAIVQRSMGNAQRALSILSVIGKYSAKFPGGSLFNLAKQAASNGSYETQLAEIRMGLSSDDDPMSAQTADLQQAFDAINNPNGPLQADVARAQHSRQRMRQQMQALGIEWDRISAAWLSQRDKYLTGWYQGLVKNLPGIVHTGVFKMIMGFLNIIAGATAIFQTLKHTSSIGDNKGMLHNMMPQTPATGFIQPTATAATRQRKVLAEDATPQPTSAPDDPRTDISNTMSDTTQVANQNQQNNPANQNNPVNAQYAANIIKPWMNAIGKYSVITNQALQSYAIAKEKLSDMLRGGADDVYSLNTSFTTDTLMTSDQIVSSAQAIEQLLDTATKAINQELAYFKQLTGLRMPPEISTMVQRRASELQAKAVDIQKSHINTVDLAIIVPIEQQIKQVKPLIDAAQNMIQALTKAQQESQRPTAGIQPYLAQLCFSQNAQQPGYPYLINLYNKAVESYKRLMQQSTDPMIKNLSAGRLNDLSKAIMASQAEMVALRPQFAGDIFNKSVNDPAMMGIMNSGEGSMRSNSTNIFHKDKFIKLATDEDEIVEADQEGEDYWAGFYSSDYAKKMFEGDNPKLDQNGQMIQQRKRKKINLNP